MNDTGQPIDIPDRFPNDWKTKPTDRFILKWVKCNLSARITPRLLGARGLRPWMITLAASGLGTMAGAVFAFGPAWAASAMAACAQVLDGVDGQFARLTNAQSRAGAFWDSVLDRYADGALVIGLTVWIGRNVEAVPYWLLGLLGFLAVVGSGLISYSTARAECLAVDLGRPTLASKGTRTFVVVVCGFLTVFSCYAAVIALLYLAIHTNLVIVGRLIRAHGSAGDGASQSAGDPGGRHGGFPPRSGV